ncbi:MAG: LysM peptidoglycan-binding domain-containing protein [Candidatus Berkelbacteria bacterium]|nr:LysM peptidoglycan-binding domain-containing protein [Candidatus Berkelbacteria bacterium]
MDNVSYEPPSRIFDLVKAHKIRLKIMPAQSGPSRLALEKFKLKALKFKINLLKALLNLKKSSFNFTEKIAEKNGFTKPLLFQLLVLIILSLLPWISQASADQQAYSDSIHYTQPIDPIQEGRLAVYLSQYTPGIYVDADNIALAEMTQEDSNYTLTQQLSVNTGKDIEVPDRQDATYTLKQGETITQVAVKFNLHVGTLIDANGIKPEDLKKVKPGTVLIIPSSDTDTSSDWLVAVNKAEEDAKVAAAQAAAKAAAAAAKKTAAARNTVASTARTVGRAVSSEISIIGTSYEQCVPWAREQSGVGIHGYAGDIAPTQSTPRVGGVALDRFYGHASVVVGVGDGYIIVHEANWIRGKVTERKVSTDAIRGYVY